MAEIRAGHLQNESQTVNIRFPEDYRQVEGSYDKSWQGKG
jgi:hypothetical protein